VDMGSGSKKEKIVISVTGYMTLDEVEWRQRIHLAEHKKFG